MTKRAAPETFIEVFRNAVDRGMDMVDAALDPMIEAGRAPLEEKLTLKLLQSKPIPDAEVLLRDELRRRTKVDEVTGIPIPDRETVELATRWLSWVHDEMQGGE